MKLSRVQIKNFRSVANATISLHPSCRILVGVNEAGKSNILRALSLLDKETMPTVADIREVGRNENPKQEAYVRFIFALDDSEIVEAWEAFQTKVFENKESSPFVSRGGKNLTLKEFCEQQNEILYIVDLHGGEKRWSRWAVPSDLKMYSNWKKPTNSNVPIPLSVGTPPKSLNSLLFVNTEDDLGPPPTAFADTKLDEVAAEFQKEKLSLVQDKLPQTVYWTYSESNLLPSQIDIQSFLNDPNFCRPLKNMFLLAGYENISGAIKDAIPRPNGMRNLVRRVSESASLHMARVWKECGGVKIHITYNGGVFESSIEDAQNVYDFVRRSDGFKRFISFLLMISAEAANGELTNTLYLHDEPDISLHPTGARYLRDELIKISEKNYVVYSTHSIFMIDQEKINRHLIVKKENEITRIEEAGESNVVDEEVLYNALGFSVFEHLKAKNIIFEGWRDKHLFRMAMADSRSLQKDIPRHFDNVGLCHAEGVKDIPKLSAIMELANRQCLILSDSDKTAKEKQRTYRGYGKWYCYDELLTTGPTVTVEDFIKPEIFITPIAAIRAKYPHLPDVNAIDLKEISKLAYLREWMERGKIPSNEYKEMLSQVKEQIFSSLKSVDIEDSYFSLLEQLAIKVENGSANQ